LSTDASADTDKPDVAKQRTYEFTFVYPQGQPYISYVKVLDPTQPCHGK
jgi:hypothetical protein